MLLFGKSSALTTAPISSGTKNPQEISTLKLGAGSKIKIFITDDQFLIRSLIKKLASKYLQAETDEIIECSDGLALATAYVAYRREHPNTSVVIFLDQNMGGLEKSGLIALEKIRCLEAESQWEKAEVLPISNESESIETMAAKFDIVRLKSSAPLKTPDYFLACLAAIPFLDHQAFLDKCSLINESTPHRARALQPLQIVGAAAASADTLTDAGKARPRSPDECSSEENLTPDLNAASFSRPQI
ncbi:MAG: hypothetical protein K0S08_1692 [Gammaproteobacteria bacterium]|jgi:DNA-binding NarL/FixJ family response regulator|nr:hypothetical protein [Gammaproteobacteria bacterium]